MSGQQPSKDLSSVLIDAAQLMHGWKQADPHEWSEWDDNVLTSVREQIQHLEASKRVTGADLAKTVDARAGHEPAAPASKALVAAPENPTLDDLIAFYAEGNFRSGVTVRVPYRATREALERLRASHEPPAALPPRPKMVGTMIHNECYERGAVANYCEAVEAMLRPAASPLAVLDSRLDAVKREMATDLYSRAAAVLRAYAQDAGDDHSVGICNCSDMALADELDSAARASQPPGDVPGLLHTLEVLRQRWSHNTNFEATIGACITEIELCVERAARAASTKPAVCAHLPNQAAWCPKCSGSGEGA